MGTEWRKEEHPNWYKDVSHMRYLILGSFPPHPSKQLYPFYYPNRRNRFWKILADVAGKTLRWTKGVDVKVAVEERFEIMKKLGVGVQNMGLEVERKGESSLDTHIRILKFQNIVSIIEAHPELEIILLPGYSAPHSTAKSFNRYIQEHGFGVFRDDLIKPEPEFQIQIRDRILRCVVLNSTSTATRIKYDFLMEQFRKYLQ